MKNLFKLMLAAGALIAFSGAQAGNIDFNSCSPSAGAGVTTWVDGNYDGSAADGIAANSECFSSDLTAANETNKGSQIEAITGTSATLSKVYDSTEGNWTAITGSDADAGDGSETITLNGQGGLDCSGAGSCFLLVKDGGVATPNIIIFDLSGWDGTEIKFTGVYAGQGSISGYQFWAGPSTVPEPMTLLLLGAGLVGFGVRRKLLA